MTGSACRCIRGQVQMVTIKGEVRQNEPLSKHTSFRIGGPADLFACPADREDLISLVRQIRKLNSPSFILGGGTNLLVRDGGFRGVVISLERLDTIRIEREYRSVGGNFAIMFAEAGAPLARLHVFSIEQGLTGLEYATGIPGTVGGAVRMNAGTSLGETGDIVESVSLITPDGEPVSRGREQMGFGYRTAKIPEGHIVADVRFVLRRGDKEKIRDTVQRQQEQRRERQPWGSPNAGSVFKNPHEMAAGKLIEEAKLKGRRVGDAQVSEKHANFIVNLGHATAKDVLDLMEIVKRTVLDTKGVRLEPEIKIVGED
jgi:UDP-N-acetylmuramate dehydrogenase